MQRAPVDPSKDLSVLTLATAPPQASPAEIKAHEQEAVSTVQAVIVGAVLLYICKFPSLVIFGSYRTNSIKAPFAVDAVKKLI